MAPAAIAAEVARQTADRPMAEPLELAEDDEGRAVALFLALGTQWRWTSMGGGMAGSVSMMTGLDYTAIAPAAAALGIAVDRAVMLDLREIEAAALDTMAAQARTR